MMNVLDISNEEDKQKLREFSLLEHPSTFRYFKKRVFDEAIVSHVITLMYSTYGYAHIDRDVKTQRCYLGICVLPEYQHQGIGTKLMSTLLKLYTDEVYLTVDKDNASAIRLYERFGFCKIEEAPEYVLYKKTPAFQLEVSIGEAVDKLTILDIKLEKIQDALKKYDCTKEQNGILKSLQPYMTDSVSRFYKWLAYINKQIWELQDELRNDTILEIMKYHVETKTEKTLVLEKGRFKNTVPLVKDVSKIIEAIDQSNRNIKQEINPNQQLNMLRLINKKFQKIIDLNDMRFRVKKRINALFDTSFQEQKGYSKQEGLFLAHLGMGDMINMNGAIRYSALMVDKLYVISKHCYSKNSREMFRDDPCIEIIECNNDASDIVHILSTKKHENPNIRFILAGLWFKIRHRTNIPFDFYDDLEFPYEIRKVFSHFHTLNSLPVPDIPYIFTHSASSTTYGLPFENILDVNKILTIDPNRNYYPAGHTWFDLAESYVNKPLLSYLNVIENASEIHVTDSSFYCLCCFVETKASVKVCYNRSNFTKSNQYMFN
jgi:GNAT superfamily N-acetyltransferase